jgi:hypothetical protein
MGFPAAGRAENFHLSWHDLSIAAVGRDANAVVAWVSDPTLPLRVRIHLPREQLLTLEFADNLIHLGLSDNLGHRDLLALDNEG